MNNLDYKSLLHFAWPEITLVIAALLLLALDLTAMRQRSLQARFAVAAVLGSIGCAVAIALLLLSPASGSLADGILTSTAPVRFAQISILSLSALTLLSSISSKFTRHAGEYVLLILLASAAMLFLVASQDLLVIFLSLETFSLTLYILAGFDKSSVHSAQAALKYFLFGAMSAAFLLFGLSILYGLSNSTSLTLIAASIPPGPLNPLLLIALVTTAIGFGFKVAAVPFHFWAPEVYQDAPLPSAALIATASKVASFFIFFQFIAIAFAGAEGTAGLAHFRSGSAPILAAMAVASMLLGNLAAIVQPTLRRLMAYSAIAHAGYMLLAIQSHTPRDLAALLYYVLTYALATLGVFLVLQALDTKPGADTIDSFAGLSRRAPLLSVCLAVFLLSLAGIPPLSGFFAKFYLFTSVLHANPGSRSMLAMVILAIALSAVSLFYYLRVLKRVYVSDSPEEQPQPTANPLLQLLAALVALATIALGCAPHLLLRWLE